MDLPSLSSALCYKQQQTASVAILCCLSCKYENLIDRVPLVLLKACKEIHFIKRLGGAVNLEKHNSKLQWGGGVDEMKNEVKKNVNIVYILR